MCNSSGGWDRTRTCSTTTRAARATFSVATNRSWTDADGQAQTETEWTRCATWGKLAEIAAQYAHKGSRVYVAGRLHTTRWEDAQTGEARASVEIVVDDLILLDRPTSEAPEEAQDAREPQLSAPLPTRGPSAQQPQLSAPMPTRGPSAQQPIRRPPQPVHLHDTAAQPSQRRWNDH